MSLMISSVFVLVLTKLMSSPDFSRQNARGLGASYDQIEHASIKPLP
jgi:hypothetical protein